jgi:hypothetical protein
MAAAGTRRRSPRFVAGQHEPGREIADLDVLGRRSIMSAIVREDSVKTREDWVQDSVGGCGGICGRHQAKGRANEDVCELRTRAGLSPIWACYRPKSFPMAIRIEWSETPSREL